MTTDELRALLFPGGVSKREPASRKQLKHALDRIMSYTVVLRDGLECITCGRHSRLTASHLFKRSHENVSWDELNLACQCDVCNGKHTNVRFGNDSAPYTMWFIRRHGVEEYERLYARWKERSHLKSYNLVDMIELKLSRLAKLFDKTGVKFEDVQTVRLQAPTKD